MLRARQPCAARHPENSFNGKPQATIAFPTAEPRHHRRAPTTPARRASEGENHGVHDRSRLPQALSLPHFPDSSRYKAYLKTRADDEKQSLTTVISPRSNGPRSRAVYGSQCSQPTAKLSSNHTSDVFNSEDNICEFTGSHIVFILPHCHRSCIVLTKAASRTSTQSATPDVLMAPI